MYKYLKKNPEILSNISECYIKYYQRIIFIPDKIYLPTVKVRHQAVHTQKIFTVFQIAHTLMSNSSWILTVTFCEKKLFYITDVQW